MRIIMMVISFICMLFCASCSSQHAARNELKEKSIPFTKEACSAHMVAGDMENSLLFMKAGIDTKKLLFKNEHVLFTLVQKEDNPLIALLIDRGSSVNITDSHGKTLLMHAIIDNKIKTAKMLLELNADINKADKNGNTALHHAITFSRKPLITRLILENAKQRANNRGVTPLLNAIIKKDFETARALITSGANVNAEDEAGITPLMYASNVGLTEPVSLIKELIAAGANVNATDKRGLTPILFAVGKVREETVKILLEHNADITVRDNTGRDIYFMLSGEGLKEKRLRLGKLIRDYERGKVGIAEK